MEKIINIAVIIVFWLLLIKLVSLLFKNDDNIKSRIASLANSYGHLQNYFISLSKDSLDLKAKLEKNTKDLERAFQLIKDQNHNLRHRLNELEQDLAEGKNAHNTSITLMEEVTSSIANHVGLQIEVVPPTPMQIKVSEQNKVESDEQPVKRIRRVRKTK